MEINFATAHKLATLWAGMQDAVRPIDVKVRTAKFDGACEILDKLGVSNTATYIHVKTAYDETAKKTGIQPFYPDSREAIEWYGQFAETIMDKFNA